MDPLSNSYDLSQTKTAFPMVQHDAFAKWKFLKATLDKKEIKEPSVGLIENGFGRLVKMEFELVDPAPDSDGGTILPGKPGGKMFVTTNLYAKEGAKDTAWFAKKIAQLVDALLGTADADNKKGKAPRPGINLADPSLDARLNELLAGKELVAKMRVSTDPQYGTRSEFGALYFPSDLSV